MVQSFDQGGKYDRRFVETWKPVILKCELTVSRADEILGLQPIITKIEEAIKSSDLIIAEVSEDNPNVWLEVGYALGINKPTIILCDRSKRQKLPFDVAHRPIIFYSTESKSDFEKVEHELAKFLNAEKERFEQDKDLNKIVQSNVPGSSLANHSLTLLTELMGEWLSSPDGIAISSLSIKMGRRGYRDVGISLAVVELLSLGYAEKVEISEFDNWNNETRFDGIKITTKGIAHLESLKDRLDLTKAEKIVSKSEIIDNEPPF